MSPEPTCVIWMKFVGSPIIVRSILRLRFCNSHTENTEGGTMKRHTGRHARRSSNTHRSESLLFIIIIIERVCVCLWLTGCGWSATQQLKHTQNSVMLVCSDFLRLLSLSSCVLCSFVTAGSCFSVWTHACEAGSSWNTVKLSCLLKYLYYLDGQQIIITQRCFCP